MIQTELSTVYTTYIGGGEQGRKVRRRCGREEGNSWSSDQCKEGGREEKRKGRETGRVDVQREAPSQHSTGCPKKNED